MLLPHGQPVEDVVFFPGGTLVATAGEAQAGGAALNGVPAQRTFLLGHCRARMGTRQHMAVNGCFGVSSTRLGPPAWRCLFCGARATPLVAPTIAARSQGTTMCASGTSSLGPRGACSRSPITRRRSPASASRPLSQGGLPTDPCPRGSSLEAWTAMSRFLTLTPARSRRAPLPLCPSAVAHTVAVPAGGRGASPLEPSKRCWLVLAHPFPQGDPFVVAQVPQEKEKPLCRDAQARWRARCTPLVSAGGARVLVRRPHPQPGHVGQRIHPRGGNVLGSPGGAPPEASQAG